MNEHEPAGNCNLNRNINDNILAAAVGELLDAAAKVEIDRLVMVDSSE
jgi:hypothetical protein